MEAVIAFGSLARDGFESWQDRRAGRARELRFEALPHPTYPEGSSGGDRSRLLAAMRELLGQWNGALRRLHPTLRQPDVHRELEPYDVRRWAETVPIPERDLPAGVPAWMRSLAVWAERRGRSADERRATIAVRVPEDARAWRDGG